SAGGTFALSAAGPWTATLAVTIPAATSDSQPFYYRDAIAGAPSLTASLPSAWVAGAQFIRVGPPVLSRRGGAGPGEGGRGGPGDRHAGGDHPGRHERLAAVLLPRRHRRRALAHRQPALRVGGGDAIHQRRLADALRRRGVRAGGGGQRRPVDAVERRA